MVGMGTIVGFDARVPGAVAAGPELKLVAGLDVRPGSGNKFCVGAAVAANLGSGAAASTTVFVVVGVGLAVGVVSVGGAVAADPQAIIKNARRTTLVIDSRVAMPKFYQSECL